MLGTLTRRSKSLYCSICCLLMYSYSSFVVFWLAVREHRTEEEFSEQTTKRERCRIPEPSAVCGADSATFPSPNPLFVCVSGWKLHRGIGSLLMVAKQ